MSMRLQVVMGDRELAEIRQAARRQGLTVSEWVRRALRHARHGEPTAPVEHKLAAVRAAASHAFPTAEIDEMLGEIERGYLQS